MIRSTYRFAVAYSLWVALGMVLPGTAPVLAQETAKAEPAVAQAAPASEEPAEDLRNPEALAELKRATDFLTALPRFQFEATGAYDVIQEDGRRLQFEKTGVVSLQRPDRLFADVYLDDGRHRQFWYDGKNLSIAELSKKLHTQTKAPATIDGTLDLLEGIFKDPMPLSDLLYSDLAPLQERAEEADIVDNAMVDGRPCTHLAFRGETVDWQLWVEQGERPFIRKVVVTYREQPGTPQFVAWLDEWQTPEKFSADKFTFAAPAGSQWIDLMVAVPQTSTEGGQP